MEFKSLFMAAATLAAATLGHATTLADTGTPSGNVVGAYALDGTDFYAGTFDTAADADIGSIAAHLLGGSAGETFTLSLYTDGAAGTPDQLLYSTTAVYAADGWNGASGLTGWHVSGGRYWVGIEIGLGDTLGSSSVTGALLDRGAPLPLSHTAFDAGAGYQASAAPLDFGLRVETVSAVPEPNQLALMLAGMLVLGSTVKRRRG